jgi:uncharacterized protein (DUF433 family)
MAVLDPSLFPSDAVNHIWLDERGIAWVDDTNTKVKEIVLDHLGGFTPERIHEEHPHLSLAQIHAALAYYFDHQPTVDAQLKADDDLIERLRREAGESPVVARLRAAGLLK